MVTSSLAEPDPRSKGRRVWLLAIDIFVPMECNVSRDRCNGMRK